MKIEKLPDNPYGALTLDPSCLGKHEDGWEVIGNIHEDYYKWVNSFVAYNHCSDTWNEQWVAGDFESEVYASSQEAYDDFIYKYPPEAWDYMDI